MKKSCIDCKHHVGGGYLLGKDPCIHCHADVGGYAHWTPREEKMSEDNIIFGESQINNPDKWEPDFEYENKVQMTIDQAKEMIDVCGWNPDAIKDLKKHGYIKKTAVEEAEDLYRAYATKRIHSGRIEIVEVQHEAIWELQKQIEELKK